MTGTKAHSSLHAPLTLLETICLSQARGTLVGDLLAELMAEKTFSTTVVSKCNTLAVNGTIYSEGPYRFSSSQEKSPDLMCM